MRLLSLSFATILLSSSAYAAGPTNLTVSFGSSVPKDSTHTTYIEAAGPSRVSGGEHILVDFNGYKTISHIQLTGYSLSKRGKVVIHSAVARTADSKGNPKEIDLSELSQYAKAVGSCENYQNSVQLSDQDAVRTRPNVSVYELEFVVEGFTDNDASMVLQITSPDGLPVQDFAVTRTGPASNVVIGQFIDESNYPALSGTQLSRLVERAKEPSNQDLAGKSYVCTSYTRNSNPNVDYKTRQFFEGTDGLLQSTSSLDARPYTWIRTEEGLEMPSPLELGCGRTTVSNILRMTAAGNLVSEVEINESTFISQCEARGYGESTAETGLVNATYESVIDSGKYRAGGYEFCRPANVSQ